MVNTKLLNEAIDRTGLKRYALAKQLGLSRTGLNLKIEGVNEFKGSEIQGLKIILNLSDQERDDIFFNLEMN